MRTTKLFDRVLRKKTLFWLYALFVGGYFVFPQAPEHYKFYYFAVLLPSLVLWPSAYQLLRGNALFWLLMVYILCMVLSGLWSPVFSWPEFGRVAWHGLLVASFVVITAIVREACADDYDNMLRILIFLAALSGALSIVAWYSDHPFPASRMKPLGRMEWEIRAAGVYGFFALLSLYYLQRSRGWIRWAYALAGLISVLTVLFTQTRTVLIAIPVAATVLLGRRGQIWILMLLMLGVGSYLLMPELWETMTERLVYRPAIWVTAFEQAKAHPLFGSGYLSDPRVFTDVEVFHHAHNLYLGTFRDAGLVGLVLLIAVLWVAARWALVLRPVAGDNFHLVLLVYALVNTIPNPDRLLTRPEEQWLFLLLPLILIMVDYQRLVVPEAGRQPGAARVIPDAAADD